MLACLHSFVLLSAGCAAQSDVVQLPAGAHLGVAWTKASFVENGRRERIDALAAKFGPRAELVWLGSWPKEAQSRAELLGVDHVVLVRGAKTASVGAITHEYGNQAGHSGRVRFTGAESEADFQFLRHGTEWEVCGSLEKQFTARAPWSISSSGSGSREDVVIDPEAQLVELLINGISEGADFLAGEALWVKRGQILLRAKLLEVDESRALWTLAREGAPESRASMPRATLAWTAADDWSTWRRRFQKLARSPAAADECGWCGELVPKESSCNCADASGLNALIEFSSAMLVPPWDSKPEKRVNPAEGLRGDQPAAAIARADALAEKLAAIPASDSKQAQERFQGRHYGQGSRVFVVLVGNSLGVHPILGLSPDYARPSQKLLQKGGDDIQESADYWAVRERAPFAALVERDVQDSRNRKVLRVVKNKQLDIAALEGLLEQALWASYRSK